MSGWTELEAEVKTLAEKSAGVYIPEEFLKDVLPLVVKALDVAAAQTEDADKQAKAAVNRASRLEGELGRARLDLKKLRKATVPDDTIIVTGLDLELEASIVVLKPLGGEPKKALIEVLKPYLIASNDTDLQPDTDPRQAYYSPGAARKRWPSFDPSVKIALAEPDADGGVAKATPPASLGDAVRKLIKRGTRTGYRRII